MSTAGTSQVQNILLRPRPLTHPNVNIVLVPLLPTAPPKDPLPSDIWGRILKHTIGPELDAKSAQQGQAFRKRLLLVSRTFKETVLPLLYAKPYLPTLEVFILFCERLLEGDRKWDNLRRIHHSTPGRWVESLNLTYLSSLSGSQYHTFDRFLARIFPVVPFLHSLNLPATNMMTRPTMQALAESEVVSSLSELRGVHVPAPPNYSFLQIESMTHLLRSCYMVKHLELIGSGLDHDADDFDEEVVYSPANFTLPHLQSLCILHIPYSPILQVLSRAELPELRALTISLYADKEKSDSNAFLKAHGSSLTHLTLSATKNPLENLLVLCPNLRYLSLPTIPTAMACPPTPSTLAILSIPRPTMEFLSGMVEPLMPSLRQVRIREVRYLRRGLGAGAAKTGSSAIILEWRRRLGRRGCVPPLSLEDAMQLSWSKSEFIALFLAILHVVSAQQARALKKRKLRHGIQPNHDKHRHKYPSEQAIPGTESNDGIHLAVAPQCGSLLSSVNLKATEINVGIDWDNITDIVAFGDSYTQVGNHGDGSPPAPLMYVGKNPSAGGRNSNGETWIEQFLQVSQKPENPRKLFSYASSGATTDGTIWRSRKWNDDFPSQISRFYEKAIDLGLKPESTLYVGYFGINDYWSISADGDQMERAGKRAVALLWDLHSNAGATNFLWLGVQFSTPSTDSYNRAVYTGLWDMKLKTESSSFSNPLRLTPQSARINFAFADMGRFFSTIHESFTDFGYTSSKYCLEGQRSSIEDECDEPERTVYYIGAHPSRQTHRILAEYVHLALKDCRINEEYVIHLPTIYNVH
ncbi:hypothetical protein FRC17_003305 [Serendipita sp. 399]|nr:hypothetical protein FRC17_003305 [Serendipita sp. 399]